MHRYSDIEAPYSLYFSVLISTIVTMKLFYMLEFVAIRLQNFANLSKLFVMIYYWSFTCLFVLQGRSYLLPENISVWKLGSMAERNQSR